MVKPVEDRKRNNLALVLRFPTCPQLRQDPLRDALMRPRFVEEFHVFSDHPIQLRFAHNQQMIETFSPHTASKPLAERIRPRCALGRAQDLTP